VLPNAFCTFAFTTPHSWHVRTDVSAHALSIPVATHLASTTIISPGLSLVQFLSPFQQTMDQSLTMQHPFQSRL